MKEFVFGMFFAVFLVLILFVWLHLAGKNPRHDATGDNETYRQWLDKTQDLAANPEPGGEQERAWVQGVQDAFHPFSVENVSRNFPKAYAETFYFRDAFHVFTERDAMVAYMRETAAQSPGVTFAFGTPARVGIDFYLPWVMILPDRRGGDPQRSLGVSRLRFNDQGQVVFHQDYWDSADVLVKRVPVANGLIEMVRRRF